MIYRITLTHPIEGTVTADVPEGWQDATIGFERSTTYWSISKFFKSQFSVYGQNLSLNGQRDWIKMLEKRYGPDAEITCAIEGSDDDIIIDWVNIFTGTLPIILFYEIYNVEELEHSGQISFSETTKWVALLNRLENPVDLKSVFDLDGNAVAACPSIDLPLPAQAIRQKYRGHNSKNFLMYIDETAGPPNKTYGQMDFDVEETSEISQVFHYYLAPRFDDQQILDIPLEKFFLDKGGRARIKFNVCTAEFGGADGETFFNEGDYLRLWIQIGQSTPFECPRTTVVVPDQHIASNPPAAGIVWNECHVGGNVYTRFFFEDTITLQKADKIRYWFTKDNFNSERQFIILGKDGFGYMSDPQLGDIFEGYWDPGLETFPDAFYEIGAQNPKPLWKISRDGVIHGVPVYKDWIVMWKYSPTADHSQSFDDWYIGPKAPFEGKFIYENSYLEVDLDTTYPDSIVPSFFIHDIADAISKRTCGMPLKSNYLGASYTQGEYSTVGVAAPYVSGKGWQFRGYTLATKPNFFSLKDFWECFQPIFNLGMGYGKADDGVTDVLIIEDQKHFFKSDMSVIFYNVGKIKKRHNVDLLYNVVETGSEKGAIEDVSGADDVQRATWTSVFKKVGKKLSLISKAIVAPLAIETGRRTKITDSADWKYDSDNFLINVVQTEDGFQPRVNEDIEVVSGMINGDTRYNKNLTPAKVLLRFLDFISSCLQFNTPSKWKFSGGTGNTTLVTQATPDDDAPDTFGGEELSEKQDIDVSTNPIFIPIDYEIEHWMTLAQFEQIDLNRELAIGISQDGEGEGDGPKPFHIKTLEWNPETEVFTLVGWPEEYFEIKNKDVDEQDQEIITTPTEHPIIGPFDDSFDDSFDRGE